MAFRLIGIKKVGIWIIAVMMASIFGLSTQSHGASELPEGYPSKPVKLIVPWGPGGGTDTVIRLVASVADQYVGQPVVAVIKSGASGTIGHNYVSKARPDGYILVALGSTPVYVVPHFRSVPYDPMNDFTPIIQITNLKNVLVVPASSPIQSVKDFIEAAKKQPNKLTVGHAGSESTDYVGVALFAKKVGIRVSHVPAESTGEVLASLAGGHLDAVNGSVAAAYSLIQSNKIRPLAVFTDTRSQYLPDVPTFKELGYDVSINDRVGIAGPAGLPQPIVNYLHDAFKKTLDDPSFTKIAKKLGITKDYLPSNEYKEAIQRDYDAVGLVVKGK